MKAEKIFGGVFYFFSLLNISICILVCVWLANVEDVTLLLDLQGLQLQPRIILLLVMPMATSIFINVALAGLHAMTIYLQGREKINKKLNRSPTQYSHINVIKRH